MVNLTRADLTQVTRLLYPGDLNLGSPVNLIWVNLGRVSLT
jgi:hypothetical protein